MIKLNSEICKRCINECLYCTVDYNYAKELWHIKFRSFDGQERIKYLKYFSELSELYETIDKLESEIVVREVLSKDILETSNLYVTESCEYYFDHAVLDME